MTNEEKKEWLSGKYPLTVIQDRYVGVYSGARWLAFPLDYTDVPEDANGDDTICAQFWHDYKEPVGKGGCAEEAIDNLLMEMEASIPKEIDEEKVRKFLLRLAKRCPEDSLDFIGEVKKADVLAYLEKQKEQKSAEWSERDKEIANFIFGLFEALLWRKDFSIDKECVLSWLCYRLPYLETKQKPSEWNEEDEHRRKDAIYFLESAKKHYADTSEIEKTIDWIKSLRPQPKQEWSGEDEEMLKWLCRIVHSQRVTEVITLKEESELGNWMDKWLNHNPQPHWKPSEEQMKALRNFSTGVFIGDGDCDALRSLYDDLKKL